jgi:hypothetical protein
MSETVQANDGVMLPLSSLPTSITYSGDLVQSMTVAYQGNSYQQTFGYSGTNVISISNWVKL